MTEARTCKCGKSTGRTSLDVLRVKGWRIFDGLSQTGKPLSETVCPWCAGTATEPAPTWRVGCNTCYWEWEDDYDEGPLSQKEAKRIADDHECEPDTWVREPKADDYTPPVLKPVQEFLPHQGGTG